MTTLQVVVRCDDCETVETVPVPESYLPDPDAVVEAIADNGWARDVLDDRDQCGNCVQLEARVPA